jgi:hypothetical protein
MRPVGSPVERKFAIDSRAQVEARGVLTVAVKVRPLLRGGVSNPPCIRNRADAGPIKHNCFSIRFRVAHGSTFQTIAFAARAGMKRALPTAGDVFVRHARFVAHLRQTRGLWGDKDRKFCRGGFETRPASTTGEHDAGGIKHTCSSIPFRAVAGLHFR